MSAEKNAPATTSEGIGRRSFMRGAAGFSLLASGLAAPNLARGQSARPNVLMIVLDDLNDWVEPLKGYPGVRTPNIAKLAATGRVYLNAQANVPACSPSRTSTLFGMHPTTTGGYTNAEEWQYNRFLRNYRSLPFHFRNNGYATYATGKVFHSHSVDAIDGIDPDAWNDFQFCTAGEDVCAINVRGDGDAPLLNGQPMEFSQYARTQGGFSNFDFGPYYTPEEVPDTVRARWMANNILNRSHGQPFFAACGIMKPHLPFIVPREFFNLYPGRSLVYPPGVLDRLNNAPTTNRDLADLGTTGGRINSYLSDHNRLIQSGEWLVVVQSYLAAISYADFCVGILMNSLRRGPNANNTIVVLWSDNGFQLGEKLAWRKFTLWERSLRVPFIFAGPGIQRTASTMPASLIDIYPTLCDFAFGSVPNHLQGRSLRSNLTTGANTHGHSVATWLEPSTRPSNGPHFSIRTAEHRYIRYESGEEELYDHRYDPYETNNLLFAGTRVTQGSLRVANRLRPLVPAGPYSPRRGVAPGGGSE